MDRQSCCTAPAQRTTVRCDCALMWVEGGEMKEAEVLITDAKVVGDVYGMAVQYSVKLEAGDTPVGKMGSASFFVDDVGWAVTGSLKTILKADLSVLGVPVAVGK